MNIRTAGFIAISIATAAVWFALAPPAVDTEAETVGLSGLDYVDLVDQALADGVLNESRAESAPQQQVVNGWTARDLLSIIALAQADTLSAVTTRDDRTPALIGLAALAVCWGGAIPSRAHERANTLVLASHPAGNEGSESPEPGE